MLTQTLSQKSWRAITVQRKRSKLALEQKEQSNKLVEAIKNDAEASLKSRGEAYKAMAKSKESVRTALLKHSEEVLKCKK